MASARHHDYDVTIAAGDIDATGHVNHAIHLKWVQAAVVEHWHRVATPEAVAAYRWIAVRHAITYRRPAFLADRLVAGIRLEAVRRESAFYETVIRRGEAVIAHVESRWCCIDAASGRPVRVPDEVRACFFPGPDFTGTGG